MAAWERAWKRNRGAESPQVPNRRDRFLFDFLPMKRRVITREGIELDGLHFSHPSLQSEVNPNEKRVVRIDPRDVSKIYLETQAGPYLPVPLQANGCWRGMSWWEWWAIKRQRREMRHEAQLEPKSFGDDGLSNIRTPMRANRARARKDEWLAAQAIQALPSPDTSLHPVIESRDYADLPSWEILE